MPHLVEVNEKYRDKGIEILMATDVDQAPALEKFIAEKNLHVGVVRVPDVYKLVKASGYPTSYGIDVDGKCIWRGHPQGLNDNLVEGWLKDMRAPKLPRKLSDELARAAADYESQKYGKALEGAQKLLKHKTDQVRADAQYLYDIVAGRLAMNQEAAKIHREGGYLDRLLPLLELDAEQFEDNDWAKDCAKESKKLKGSKDYKKCVDARDELAKLKPELEKMKAKDAKKALEKIAKDFKGTPYADEAGKLAEAVKE